MPETKKDQVVGKRQQIHKSGRMMFAWVAGASVVASFAIVSAGFLIQRIVFETKVTGEKQSTVKTLRDNNEAVDKLRGDIKVLNTNAALSSVRLNDDEQPIRVILDSLPADNNPLALGSSVQLLISRVPGVKLESFQMGDSNDTSSTTTTTAVTNTSGSSQLNSAGSSEGVQQIPFTLTVSAGSADSLKDMLKNFEKSIRVIDIDSMTVEQEKDRTTMKISGHGYYLPGKTIKLTKKEVKP